MNGEQLAVQQTDWTAAIMAGNQAAMDWYSLITQRPQVQNSAVTIGPRGVVAQVDRAALYATLTTLAIYGAIGFGVFYLLRGR